MTSPDDRQIPYAPGQPTPPVTPPTRRRPMLPWILIGALAVALAAALIVPRLGSDPKPAAAGKTTAVAAAAAKPQTLNIPGTLDLSFGQFTWNADTALCWGRDGYDDIAMGAAVTITDSAGTVIAVGEIATAQAGEYQKDGSPSNAGDPDARPTQCELSFAVADVPAGKGFYGVEVSHRGSVKYAEANLATPISLTIG